MVAVVRPQLLPEGFFGAFVTVIFPYNIQYTLFTVYSPPPPTNKN